MSNVRLTENDMESIPFYIKGMEPAPEDTGFKFTFVKDKNGNFNEPTKQLYRDINRYGPIKIRPYEYTISGIDKHLINARLVG